ncbi:MAG: response regulator transcription factor [Candidatus Sericytochromatia bacterium]|nr:response regulator transcription factor [Candidatus Sericytochromatia bacterium]
MVFLHYHILLIEDDSSFAMAVSELLRSENYLVSAATNGAEAIELIEKDLPHLIISDISLPDINGLQLLKYLQKHLNHVPPYLFLTGKAQELDIVLGLEYGADDYITKPFQPSIFLARVEKILHRHYPQTEQREAFQYQLMGLKLNADKRQAFFHDHHLDLKRHEFELLLYLLQHPKQIFSRGQLLKRIWETESEISPRNIDGIVVSLRKKISQAGGAADLIETVRGLGYRLKN